MKPVENVLKRQMELGRRRAERMLRRGDDPTKARTVQHVAYFLLRPEPAERAASELASQGYRVSRSTAGFHHVLQFERTATLTEASQAVFLAQIVLTVRLNGGSYDGWRASITTPASSTTAPRPNGTDQREEQSGP